MPGDKKGYKKIDKEFLYTDSSLNSYKYRLLTSGYLMSEFARNPIGYYMHGTKDYPREAGVLVKWEDLRQDGDKVYAKPCINLDHPRGEQTVREIENGFLNAASVGQIVALEISNDPNDYLEDQTGPTVTKWFNRELSLCDIPGNFNALTDLVDANNKPINLADYSKPQLFNMKQIFLTPAQLALIPNLKAESTQEEVNTAIADLVAKASQVDALNTTVQNLTTANTKLKQDVEDLKTAGDQKQVEDLLAASLGVKTTKEQNALLAVQFKGKPADLKAYLDVTPNLTGVVKNLKGGDGELGEKFKGKTYAELDKAGLLPALKAEHPNTFFKMYEEKYKKKHAEDNRS